MHVSSSLFRHNTTSLNDHYINILLAIKYDHKLFDHTFYDTAFSDLFQFFSSYRMIFIIGSVPLFILISLSFSLCTDIFNRFQGRQSWGFWGVAISQNLGTGVVGNRRDGGGSWMGRKILLYLIMYRKYVRKWCLLKRNRIIWPEVAVNGHFLCLENQIF